MHLPLEPFFNRHALEHKLIAKKGAWYGQTRDAANKFAREEKKIQLEDRQERGQDTNGMGKLRSVFFITRRKRVDEAQRKDSL